MPKFVKKPIVVEAFQLTAEYFDGEHPNPLHPATENITYYPDLRQAVVETLEGYMNADEGDWIIRGVQGEYYPCKPDIFEQTYERVSETEQVYTD